ncbi:MAG: hypothetical protein WCT44_04020 [Candidatus Paceibacterota bacterium]
MNKNILLKVIGSIVVIGIIVVLIRSNSTNNSVSEIATSTVDVSVQNQSQTATTSTSTVSVPKKVYKTNTSTYVAPAVFHPSSLISENTQTLKNLLASGKVEQCSFTDVTPSSNIQGVAYISGNKARVNMEVSASGVTTSTRMIVLGQDVYVWPIGMTNGYKTTVVATATTQPTANPNTSGINADKQIAYHCSSWVADPSFFVVPLSVTFK